MKGWLMALALVGATPAVAQTVSGARPDSVAAALREAGYRAELTKDDSGDPLIKSSASGASFLLLFYNCKENKDCSTVQFFAGFKKSGVTLQQLNDWNTQYRFGRAYLTKEGSARIEMDVDLDKGGMSSALFIANVKTWEALLADFQKAIDY